MPRVRKAVWTDEEEERRAISEAGLHPRDVGFPGWLNTRLGETGADLTSVAAMAGISHGYLSMLRSGQRLRPSGAVVDALAAALGASPDDARRSAGLPPSPSRPMGGAKLRGVNAMLPSRPQAPGAAYDPDWYMARPKEERRVTSLLESAGAPAVVWGPVHIGKTWLIRNVLRQPGERRGEHQSVILNLRGGLGDEALTSSSRLFHAFATKIVSDAGGPPAWVDEIWKENRSPGLNLSAVMEERVLHHSPGRFILALDQVDELIGRPFQDDVFGLFRAWAEDGDREPWSKLRLLIGVSANPTRLTNSITQSPFNLTPPVRLGDLEESEVRDLAHRYRIRWATEELDALFALVGGHPYLTRLAFWNAAVNNIRLGETADEKDLAGGPFGLHLEGRMNWLDKHPELAEALKQLLKDPKTKLESEAFYELQRAGLVEQEGGAFRIRYPLYEKYLKARL